MHLTALLKNTSCLLLILLSACSSNDTESQSFCVEYEATDINGNPEYVFFAYNVKTHQEGKDLLANRIGGGINEAIREGSCDHNIGICTQQWVPVCAIITSSSGEAPQKTFSNLCMLKSEVKKLSGNSSKAKASFAAGDCK